MGSQSLSLSVVAVGTQRLEIIPAGPGRLLSEAYLAGGRVVEKKFNRLAHHMGLGPNAVAKRIEHRLETPERLMRPAELSEKVTRELEKDCRKLMKHALPCVIPCFSPTHM